MTMVGEWGEGGGGGWVYMAVGKLIAAVYSTSIIGLQSAI